MVCLFALFGTSNKRINLKKINFSSTASSELYFKNMRSYFYDKEERKDAQFVLYRIGSREQSQKKLNFILVSNWLMSEYYLISESKSSNALLDWKYKEEAGSISLTGENNRAHFVFGAELFEQLERKADIWLVDSDKRTPFTEEEKASLKTSLIDYFKLVGKLR